MARFKTVKDSVALLLLMVLLVVGEERSILDGAEVLCVYGNCNASWATDAMISRGFRQMTIQAYDAGSEKELIIDLKQSYVVKTVYLSHFVYQGDWDTK